MKNTKLYYDNANSESHTEALGIDKERGDEIAGASIRAVLGAQIEPEIKNSGDMVEAANQNAAPQNMQEAFFLGWSLAKAESEIEKKFNDNPLAQLFKMMGK